MYSPTKWDWMTLFGSVGLFLTLQFLFIRLVPMISISETRELVAEPDKATIKCANITDCSQNFRTMKICCVRPKRHTQPGSEKWTRSRRFLSKAFRRRWERKRGCHCSS